MRTGLFYLFETLGKKSPAQVYREAIEDARFGEALGFSGVHPAEHHFSDHYGIMPRGELFLAACATATERMRLAPMVIVAPLADPVRLAEDCALIDNLSGGRFVFSVGAGYRRYEFSQLGLDIADARERLKEAVEIVIGCWTHDRFEHRGKHFTVPECHVVPRPVQQPHPPVWLTTASPEQIDWAARRGFACVPAAGFGNELLKKDRARYVAAAREAGHDPAAIDAPIFRWIYLDETDARAREVAEQAFMDTFRAFFAGGETLVQKVLERFGAPPGLASRDWPFELLTEEPGTICVYGSPDTVLRKLAPLKEAGIDYFIGGFHIGALPQAQVRRSMELYAREVMPNW